MFGPLSYLLEMVKSPPPPSEKIFEIKSFNLFKYQMNELIIIIHMRLITLVVPFIWYLTFLSPLRGDTQCTPSFPHFERKQHTYFSPKRSSRHQQQRPDAYMTTMKPRSNCVFTSNHDMMVNEGNIIFCISVSV